MKRLAATLLAAVLTTASTVAPVHADAATDEMRNVFALHGDAALLAEWDALTPEQQLDFVAFTQSDVSAVASQSTISTSATSFPMRSQARILPPPDGGGGAYQWTSMYEQSWSYLGITYTSLKLTFVYIVQAGVVSSALSCVPRFTNYVPMRSFSAQPSSYVSGGKGTCTAMWSITRDNWWTTSGEQGMRVGGAGIEAVWSN